MSRRGGKKKDKTSRRNRNTGTDGLPEIDPLSDLGGLAWLDSEGLHRLVPGTPPDQLTLELMSRAYQQQIRNSPLWDEMVREFGLLQAEALLKQCRAKLG